MSKEEKLSPGENGGYTGLIIALLMFCDGSKQMRTLTGLVAEAGRSRTTMSEIQGVGSFIRTSWPVSTRFPNASLIIGSLGVA